MEFIVSIISIALMIIGAVGIIIIKSPIDKIIMLSLLEGGFTIAVVLFNYLDLAFAFAIIAPLSSVIILLSIIKINDLRKNKVEELQ